MESYQSGLYSTFTDLGGSGIYRWTSLYELNKHTRYGHETMFIQPSVHYVWKKDHQMLER